MRARRHLKRSGSPGLMRTSEFRCNYLRLVVVELIEAEIDNDVSKG
jgi:hypothetical protein